METRVWNHFPYISSAPVEAIKRRYFRSKDCFDEVFLFLLENNKYLVIHYCGNEKDENSGFTEIEEFDNLESAVMFFKEVTGPWEQF